jgi:hypothetical protein
MEASGNAQTASASNTFASPPATVPSQPQNIPSPTAYAIPAQPASVPKDAPPAPRAAGLPLPAIGDTSLPRVAQGSGTIANALNVIAQSLQGLLSASPSPKALPLATASPLPEAAASRPLPRGTETVLPSTVLKTSLARGAAEERLATMWGVSDKGEKDETPETEEADPINRVKHKQDASDEAFDGAAGENQERNHYA